MENPQSQSNESQELREFDLMATEHLAHLSVREVAEMLENGEIPSTPLAQ